MDPFQSARCWLWLVAALLGAPLLFGVLGGCEFKGGPDAARQPAMEQYWQPKVVAMRVAPATRFTREQGATILNAHIELMDQMEDSIKSAGLVRFDLFASDEAGQALGRRLYHWDATMRTLEDQRQHFDPVTRTYHFRLQLDQQLSPANPTVLRATFTRALDGQRLQAQARVGWE